MKKNYLIRTLNALSGNLSKNAVTPEGQALIDEIRTILTDLEADNEIEYNEADIMAKLTEVAAKAGAEAAAEVASSFKQNATKKMDVNALRNLFGEALVNSAGKGKGAFKNEFEKLLSKNGVVNLPSIVEVFPEIQTAFEKTSILSRLRKLGEQNLSIPVSLQADNDTEVRAKGHKVYDESLNLIEKKEQILRITPKTLSLGAIYKKIAVPKLMSYQTGNISQLMRWLSTELIERIDNEIQRVVLVGDGRDVTDPDKINSFESIGSKTASDAYTVYREVANTLPTLSDVRELIDSMDATQPITLFAHPSVISHLELMQYAAGGSVSFIGDDVLAAQLGVSEVVKTKMLEGAVPAPNGTAKKLPVIVAIQGNSYGYVGSDLFSVSYEKWDFNADELLSEIFAGGGVIKPLSTGVIKVAVPAT